MCQALMVPGPLCPLSGSLSRQPRKAAVIIHVFKLPRGKAGFQCSLRECPCMASVQRGPAGQRVAGGQERVQEGWGCFLKRESLPAEGTCGHCGGIPAFSAALCSEEFVASALPLAGPYHLPPRPFLHLSSLSKLAQPQGHPLPIMRGAWFLSQRASLSLLTTQVIARAVHREPDVAWDSSSAARLSHDLTFFFFLVSLFKFSQLGSFVSSFYIP